jgi:hypothetical protein
VDVAATPAAIAEVVEKRESALAGLFGTEEIV